MIEQPSRKRLRRVVRADFIRYSTAVTLIRVPTSCSSCRKPYFLLTPPGYPTASAPARTLGYTSQAAGALPLLLSD